MFSFHSDILPKEHWSKILVTVKYLPIHCSRLLKPIDDRCIGKGFVNLETKTIGIYANFPHGWSDTTTLNLIHYENFSNVSQKNLTRE